MISVDSLAFSYSGGDDPALYDIDLRVADGSLFGLLGPNGAGKTTLLSIFCGLLPCRAGAVYIGGSDVAENPNIGQPAIALVPQNFAYYPTLSVRENLLFFTRMLRISPADARARIADVATITGLEGRLRDRADRLSGGLKRRLNIAIGMLDQPQLLLLDEPTVGIDPHSRHFILEAIKNINRSGTTIVYTSHYMEEVEYLCDDIAIIDSGRVLVQGSLNELLHTDSSNQLTVGLHAALSDEQRTLLVDEFEFDDRDRTLNIHIDDSGDVWKILGTLRNYGIEISRVDYGARNLEEVFLHYTKRSLRD